MRERAWLLFVPLPQARIRLFARVGRCKRTDQCQDESTTKCGDHGRCVFDAAASQGYRCECDEGFRSADGQSECEDFDECEGGVSGCQHHCENTAGSFRCLCMSGFRQDPRNASGCVDFDECAEHTNSCQQKCVNSVGSYRCDCQEGCVLAFR